MFWLLTFSDAFFDILFDNTIWRSTKLELYCSVWPVLAPLIIICNLHCMDDFCQISSSFSISVQVQLYDQWFCLYKLKPNGQRDVFHIQPFCNCSDIPAFLYLTKNLAKDKAFSHGNVKIYLFRKHQACLAICSEVFPEVLFLSRIQEIFYICTLYIH